MTAIGGVAMVVCAGAGAGAGAGVTRREEDGACEVGAVESDSSSIDEAPVRARSARSRRSTRWRMALSSAESVVSA